MKSRDEMHISPYEETHDYIFAQTMGAYKIQGSLLTGPPTVKSVNYYKMTEAVSLVKTMD